MWPNCIKIHVYIPTQRQAYRPQASPLYPYGHQPMRQRVLSVPFQLRFLFASKPEVITGVLGFVYRTITSFLTHKAGYAKPMAKIMGVRVRTNRIVEVGCQLEEDEILRLVSLIWHRNRLLLFAQSGSSGNLFTILPAVLGYSAVYTEDMVNTYAHRYADFIRTVD
jgi:hypothetical protein